MSDFDAAFREFLAEFFAQNPVLATATGEHRHDAEWPDATEAGRLARLEAGDRWLARFGALTGLTADEAIDRDLVVGELEAARFAEADLREDAWNPLEWVYLLGEGIFTLIAREFAPLADRLTRSRAGSRASRRSWTARVRRWSASRAGPSAGSRPRRRCGSCPASPS